MNRKRLERERMALISGAAQTIKCADLISNTASIARYDPGFARVYLVEKEKLLDMMLDADRRLRGRAYNSLADAQTQLMQGALKC